MKRIFIILAITSTLLADRDREREHERDDFPHPANMPETSTYAAVLVLAGLVGYGAWRRRK